MSFFQKIKVTFKMMGLASKVNKLVKREAYDEALKMCEAAQEEYPMLALHIDRLILSIYTQSGDTQKAKEIEEKIQTALKRRNNAA